MIYQSPLLEAGDEGVFSNYFFLILESFLFFFFSIFCFMILFTQVN